MSIVMDVAILKECGYDMAKLAVSLNKKKNPDDMGPVVERLCDKGDGHNKCIEFIDVWLLIRAPRYWWSECDTYRMRSMSSESTMHTIMSEMQNASEQDIKSMFEVYPTMGTIDALLRCADGNDLVGVKQHLPESFLQRRLLKVNYLTIRNMIKQRSTHRLPHWQQFCQYLKENLEHPELLKGL